MINGATMLPPCSNIEEKSTSELTFDFAEDAAGLVPEMITTVHAERDVVLRDSAVAASTVVLLYWVMSLSIEPSIRPLLGTEENEEQVSEPKCGSKKFPCKVLGTGPSIDMNKHSHFVGALLRAR